MKRLAALVVVLFGLFFAGLVVRGQEKPDKKDETTTSGARPEGPQAKVQVVFNEYDGDKKIKSLPYTLLVRVGTDSKDGPWSKIRMGSRVPVVTGTAGGQAQWQYVDVGTSIDCTASAVPEGRYRLSLTMERSWPESDGASEAKTMPSDPEQRLRQPIIRQFRSDNAVTLRDGQTLEANFATDPVTGKVIRLEVSLNVLK